jgi:hypothetical protein
MGTIRPNYFTGKLLTAEDLNLEQDYFLDKFRLHNRCLHGYGVVSGLGIAVGDGSSPVMEIEPGCAIDAFGNLIEVTGTVEARLNPREEKNAYYILLRYKECPVDEVPVLLEPCQSGSEPTQPNRIKETFEVYFEEHNPAAKRQRQASRKTCGEPGPLAIGRLRRVRKGWVLDRRFVRRRCK